MKIAKLWIPEVRVCRFLYAEHTELEQSCSDWLLVTKL